MLSSWSGYRTEKSNMRKLALEARSLMRVWMSGSRLGRLVRFASRNSIAHRPASLRTQENPPNAYPGASGSRLRKHMYDSLPAHMPASTKDAEFLEFQEVIRVRIPNAVETQIPKNAKWDYAQACLTDDRRWHNCGLGKNRVRLRRLSTIRGPHVCLPHRRPVKTVKTRANSRAGRETTKACTGSPPHMCLPYKRTTYSCCLYSQDCRYLMVCLMRFRAIRTRVVTQNMKPKKLAWILLQGKNL